MKTAASYEITKIRVNPAGGEIEELYINHEKVEMGSETLQDNKEATIDASTYSEPVEITPSSGKVAMKKATVTVSNIPVIEANKAASIDVSAYTEAVEITPTEGKNGMAKATVTLENIPVAGATLYAWQNTSDGTITGYTKSSTPEVDDNFYLSGSESLSELTVKTVGEGTVDVTISDSDVTFSRYASGDITL